MRTLLKGDKYWDYVDDKLLMTCVYLNESERHGDQTKAQIRHCQVGYEHVPEEETVDQV